MDDKWWEQSRGTAHTTVFDVAGRLEELNSARRTKLLNYARMYVNSDIAGLDPYNYFATADYNFFEHEDARARWNVVGSIVDTLTSRIAKNKPRIVMLPNRSSHEIHAKAKQLEKYINGAFGAIKAYKKGPKAFLNGCIGGTGIGHIYEENNNIALELVPPHELLIDPQESMYGDPRQMMRRKYVDRHMLMSMFPKFKGEIYAAANHIGMENVEENTIADNVTIVEAWHLRSSPKAKDGRHMLVIDNCALLDEDYTEDDFPFEFLRWKEPQMGFWGNGVIHDIIGIQVDINRTLKKIQKAHYLLSNPMVFVNAGSAISKAHINNRVGIVVPYLGEKPHVVTFSSVHPEIYAHLERQEAAAYKIAGVSQMSAQSKNILGPQASGEAIRQMEDVETDRFALASQAYEDFFKGIARKMIHKASNIYGRGEDLTFTVKGKEFLEKISWSEIDLAEDQFDLNVDTSSILPETKAGRISTAIDFYQMGIWDGDKVNEVLDISDTSGERELDRAPREYIQQVVDMILHNGVAIEPEKYDDLTYAYKYAVMRYGKAKLNDTPEEKLELLRQFINKTDMLLKKKASEDAAELQAMQMANMPQQAPATPQVPQNPVGGVPPGAM